MANVQFIITPEAAAAFSAAQDDKTVRYVVLAIADEKFVLKASLKSSTGSTGSDFNQIFVECGLDITAASFVLFCETDEDSGSRRWVLIAWVPDLCRPKDKMLYSSSRDSLKRGLGLSLFCADYYCNEAADLTWDAYQKSVHDVGEGPLSELEIQKKEEAALERDTSTKSSAMGDLPFEVLPAATQALAAFAAAENTDGPGVLALSLENEKVGVYIPSAAADGKLSQALPTPTTPAYVLCRINADVCFVYFCPDEAPIKMKMVYSTAKSTVMGVAANSGLLFSRVEEVRSVEDLDALTAPASTTAAADVPSPAQSGADLATRAAPPGKGRPRTAAKKKFVADE